MEPTYSELNSARNEARPLAELAGVVDRLSTEATFAFAEADPAINNPKTVPSFTLIMNMARNARARADATLRDDTLYPDGRKRIAAETLEKARMEIDEAFDRAEAQLTVLEADLLLRSLPKVGKGEELTARQDLATLLAAKGTDSQFLMRLAQRGDSIAGLLLSDVGVLLLEANGLDQHSAQELHRSLRVAAAHAAAKSKVGDPSRQRAGQAYVAVQKLRGAKTAAENYVRTVLAG